MNNRKTLNDDEVIEVWGNGYSNGSVGAVKAPHGMNFLELDVHKDSKTEGVYQLIQTAKGEKYTISFDIRARGSVVKGDDEAVVRKSLLLQSFLSLTHMKGTLISGVEWVENVTSWL